MKVSRRPGESSPYRPSNTSWTPAQSPLDALQTQRVGGHVPGLASHIESATRLADRLSSDRSLPFYDDTERNRRMRSVGLSTEHIEAWGQDTWNTATHILRQRRNQH